MMANDVDVCDFDSGAYVDVDVDGDGVIVIIVHVL